MPRDTKNLDIFLLSGGRPLFPLLIALFELAGEQIANVLGGESVVLNWHHLEKALDLLLCVLLAEGYEGGLNVVAFDEASVIGEGLERSDHHFILIGGTTSLLLAEHIDELGEVDGGGAVGDHSVDLLVGERHSDLVGGRSDVPSTDDAVLVTVHELEPFLELSYLPLGELVEDIGSTSFLGLLLLLLLLGGGGGGSRHDCN